MRVLVVEDEPDLREGLAKALREDGYAVDSAADGEDGFFKAEGTEYDAESRSHVSVYRLRVSREAS